MHIIYVTVGFLVHICNQLIRLCMKILPHRDITLATKDSLPIGCIK